MPVSTPNSIGGPREDSTSDGLVEEIVGAGDRAEAPCHGGEGSGPLPMPLAGALMA